MSEGDFDRFFLALSPPAREELVADYAARALAEGAYVRLPDGVKVPIPPIVTPIAVAPAALAQVRGDAQLLARGLTKVAATVMEEGRHAALRERLFAGFTALERQALVAGGWQKAERLATLRVDFFSDADGAPRALEVNTTIPAMQGYSDAIAAAFLGAVAAARGLGPAQAEALIAANGRNSDDLLRSLLAHHDALGGGRVETLAIIARAGDAQEGELQHYLRRWTALGHEVLLATPDEVRLVDGHAEVRGVRPDLLYRHVFARRLDPESDFARICLEAPRHRLFNPIASHLEIKAMLGLLSAASGADATVPAPLDDDERAAAARLPWTRLLVPGPTEGSDGRRLPDLVAWVKAHPERLVLKRSWDYGGKGVFLGADVVAASGDVEPGSDAALLRARLQALLGRPADAPVDWAALCDHALASPDAWVVQGFVAARAMPLWCADPTRPSGSEQRALYVDLSVFGSLGVAVMPEGGAVRASRSRIVNILGGGGLAPLVRPAVLAALLG